jgi:hypothetical protein
MDCLVAFRSTWQYLNGLRATKAATVTLHSNQLRSGIYVPKSIPDQRFDHSVEHYDDARFESSSQIILRFPNASCILLKTTSDSYFAWFDLMSAQTWIIRFSIHI